MSVIKNKIYAHCKDIVKQDEIELKFTTGETTKDLENKIRKIGGEQIVSMPFRIALNHEFVLEPKKVNESDEIALIPPVQGG